MRSMKNDASCTSDMLSVMEGVRSSVDTMSFTGNGTKLSLSVIVNPASASCSTVKLNCSNSATKSVEAN